uniref:BPTI/Kunitz inhibitor domain-containing protein n=1 Tax=Gopherus agassizii TaxID=38772 RepID=A0A452IJP9_9SAUR
MWLLAQAVEAHVLRSRGLRCDPARRRLESVSSGSVKAAKTSAPVPSCPPTSSGCRETDPWQKSLLLNPLSLCPLPADIRSLPTEMGLGAAAIPRWVCNWHAKKCEEFSYGGCHGNKNNFETKVDCLQACKGFYKA